jgi:hypothetical protein
MYSTNLKLENRIAKATEGWLGRILFPGVVGLILGDPIGLVRGAVFGGIIAYDYKRH